jgi:hypothetical protein
MAGVARHVLFEMAHFEFEFCTLLKRHRRLPLCAPTYSFYPPHLSLYVQLTYQQHRRFHNLANAARSPF